MGIFSGNPTQARYSGQLQNLQLTQSVFGTTLPIIFGTRRVAMKLLFYGGFYAVTAPSQSGKGGGGAKGNQQFEYYADLIGALASGSASGGCRGILNVWDQQGRLQNESAQYVYTIPSGGGAMSPLAAGAAPIQMDLGVTKSSAYSVVANDYGAGGSQTLTGTQQVAFEKVTGTPGAGQYSFNAATSEYTFAAADAGAQVTISYSSTYSLYYFETTQAAEVPLSSPYQVSTNNQQYFWQDQGVVRVDTGAALTLGAGSNGYTVSGGVYTFTPDLAGVYVYINYSYTSSNQNITNGSQLNLTFFGGTLGQTPWSYMQSKYAGSAFGYTGVCYIGANPMDLGLSATLPSYNYEVVGLDTFQGTLDAHFCDAFRKLLYDAFLGVGFPQANVDAWTSCYAYWAANGYLGSFSLDTQVSVADAMGKVIETGNVGAFFSEGLLKLAPYGDTTVVGNGYTYSPPAAPVATLTWDDLLDGAGGSGGEPTDADPLEVAQRAQQDCWNYVQAQYANRANDYNNELINEQNDAFITRFGRRIESPQTWDWITSEAAATWALNLRLKRNCYIRNTYKFQLPFSFAYLEPMDMLELPTGEIVRVTEIDEDPGGRLSIGAEQWSYGTANVSITPKQPSASYKPNLSSALPGDAVPVVVQQPPAQSGGVTGTLQIAATGKSADWGGANVYVSLDDQTYTLLDTIYAPAAAGILSAALSFSSDPDVSDTLSVDLTLSPAGTELVTVSQLLADKFTTLCAIVDAGGDTGELVSYETATLAAAGRYNLTYLRRGVYGSIPAVHAAGAWFAFLGPNYKFAKYLFGPSMIGHTIYLKLQSFNLAGRHLQDLATVQNWAITLGYASLEAKQYYRPSTLATFGVGGAWTPTQSASVFGAGSLTNPLEACDGDFSTSAVFDGGSFAAAQSYGSKFGGSAAAIYAGFASIVLESPAVLYVAYKNLQGVMDSTDTYGGQASVSVAISGTARPSPMTSGKLPSGGGTTPLVTATPNGTATFTLEPGLNLANLAIEVSAQTAAQSGGTAPAGCVPGHIEILDIWVEG